MLLLHYRLIHFQQHLNTLSTGLWHINPLVTPFWWHTTVIHILCLSQSLSLGPWIIDSCAIDHVFGNHSLFSSFTTPAILPSTSTANVSQTQACGFDTTQLPQSLIVNSVLYVPIFPFNLLFVTWLTKSHDIIVTFTKNNTLQNRISTLTIGVGCESHELYYLSLSLSLSP